jgi:hypothetical protein
LESSKRFEDENIELKARIQFLENINRVTKKENENLKSSLNIYRKRIAELHQEFTAFK